MSTFYAIRHKPSGYFLPRFGGRAGGTFVEPDDKAPPRLFSQRAHAASALRWWLQGKAHGGYDYYTGEPDPDLTITPVPGRNAEDMEIVKVSLIEEHVPKAPPPPWLVAPHLRKETSDD